MFMKSNNSFEDKPKIANTPMTLDEFIEKCIKMGLGEVAEEVSGNNNGRPKAKRANSFTLINTLVQLVFHIIYLSDNTICYSNKGIGKTPFAMYIAYAVALGASLFEVFRIINPGNVLYVDGEIGRIGLSARLRKMNEMFGITTGPDPIYTLAERLNLYIEEDRQYIENEILSINSENEIPVKLLVLDNLTSMNGGKDSTSGWDEFFSWITKLNNELNLSVFILFHTNEEDEILGSKLKKTNIDNLIYLERIEDE